jgi:hypothetical protein
MNNIEKIQWKLTEKAKKKIIKWAKKNSIEIHEIHFIPMYDFSLEIYIFFVSDKCLQVYEENSITQTLKENFIDILSKLEYMDRVSSKIDFVFDSHENVVKNYNGSYFFRLR